MALTTRCPQCGTSFKVVPDQLRVRNGLVRCGACATVFDGRACLLPATGVPAADVPKPAAVTPQIPPAPAEPPASAVPQAIAAPVLAPSP
ncbi:zinc-ribbon domain-containing protein, partial [Achromobacter pulmonis]